MAPSAYAQQQVQRGVHGGGGGGARGSPFAPDNAPPASPGGGTFQPSAASNFSPQMQQMQLQLQQQQQHQMRLQRALSHPAAAAGAAPNGPHQQQMQNVAGECPFAVN